MNPIKEREAKRVYDIFWDSYQKGDLQTFASTLDEDFEMIGTSESEIAHSKADGIRFFKSQMDEVVGIAEMRNRQITVLPRDHYILINEVCDIYVLTGSDWNFYSKIRISTWLKESENGWKVAQQHGSFPDMRVKEGETLAIDKINKENLELRDAIKRRTIELENKSKELEIEAALERIRTVAMGMKSPDDMLQVCRIIATQLAILGVKQIRNVQTAIIESKEEIYLCYQYFPSYDRDVIERTEYPKNPVEKEMVDQMLAAKDNHFMGVLKNEELKDFREHRKIENYLTDPLLDEVHELGYCFLSIGEGGLGLTLYQSLDEQSLALFKRFHQVFSLAYQRFRDIQKAEAQTREAEIQLALERVRAKTMAMNTQSDLLGVIKLFGEQLNAVNIKFDNLTFIEGAITKERDWDLWSYVSLEGGLALKIHIPYFQSPYFLKTAKAVEKYEKTGQPIHVKTFTDKEKNEFLDHYWKHVPEMPKELVNSVYSSPGSTIVDAFMGEITVSLVRWDLEDYREDELKIFERFAKEFRQTYIRFLDIKKAEAQAREARIEAGLERVRSKSLAMYQTNELQSVIHTVHEELLKLNLSVFGGSFIVINSELDSEIKCWGAGGTANTSNEVHIPRFEKPFYTNLLERIKKGPGFFTEEFSEDEKVEFFTFLFTREPWSNLSAEDKKQTLETKGGYTRSCVVSEHTSIFIINHEGIPFSDADNDILKRFGKVFDQAYTRFLDLKKAEEQAREAEIELGLERVRARAMAIRKSDELVEIIQVIFRELKTLGFDLLECSLVTFDKDSKDLIYWSEGALGSAQPSNARLQFIDHPVLVDLFNDFEKGVPYRSGVFSGNLLKTWWDRVFEETDFKSAPAEYISSWKKVKKVFYFQAFMTHGFLEFVGKKPLPENKANILKRFTRAVDLAYTRYDDVLNAEAQAREAQIEAALERVRASSMAMHKTDELAQVVEVLFQQFSLLTPNFHQVWINIFFLEEGYSDCWFSPVEGIFPKAYTARIPLGPFEESSIKSWRAGEEFSYLAWDGLDEVDAAMDGLTKLTGHPSFGQIQKKKRMKRLEIVDSNHQYGVLAMANDDDITKDDRTLLKRFSKVFEQTYTRFLDLQKAEAQAREAEIELALERIRARTMAMQKSEELTETSLLLFQQFKQLGDLADQISIGIIKLDEGVIDLSATYNEVKFEQSYKISIDEPFVLNKAMAAWKKNQKSILIVLEGKELMDYNNWRNQLTGLNFSRDEKTADRRLMYIAFFSKGMVSFSTYEERPKETLLLLERFAAVFDQTYTRFLDLQKAEVQAREAKIEAALERVRAAGMAMHQSEDLAEASTVLFEQLLELGVEARRVGFALPNDEKQEFTVWSTIRDDDGKARLLSAFLHYDQHPIYPKMIENWHEGQKTFGFELHGPDLQDYYKAWNKTFKTPGSLEKTIKENESEYYQFASFEQGLIYAFTAAPLSGEEHQLLSRFARAFELTYTRFLDLQKAEGQAREAQIEAALERVRSRTMAMQHSDELAETAAVLFHQLISLGVKHERINIGIVSEKEKLVEFWSTEQSGNIILNSFTGSISEPTVLHKLYQGWKQKRESLVIHLEGDELKQWITYCKNEIGIPFDERQLGEQRFQTAAFFSKGMLMLTTPDQPPAESSELLIRFSSVFNLTFTRFSDLKVAEANAVKAADDLVEIKNAREKAEQALSDLKSAQEQLVQQEKLASLGQLTAGIAHEIKNPLNFVNNFSDLSRELIEEVFEVFDQMEDSKTKEEVLEILQDVRNNLNKIHEHGSRADSIVTSMLQHSRASGNKQELKEFNPLVKEFVNLSFHGMRAGKNPINVEIIQELDPMIKEVNLIQEDFSRVILNLCNNAFDAMRDKFLKTENGRRETEDGNSYLPRLTVTTSLQKERVILSFADNGGGIPKEIQNKVFQPFFTTKKGTEGTGLGLSITHDIIKAHGGELKLETSLGEGSIFSISIPIR
ncbi:ATP-binding protein [Algoriphagus marinus]|uniref:ATP-binding protein n=1 Tax=Algoriphagus marinus TaxID=1925762 RepID=UPI00094B950F|nr:ATP-binding protein [Algoriphagus marinus]